jgi:hypothetical protein
MKYMNMEAETRLQRSVFSIQKTRSLAVASLPVLH